MEWAWRLKDPTTPLKPPKSSPKTCGGMGTTLAKKTSGKCQGPPDLTHLSSRVNRRGKLSDYPTSLVISQQAEKVKDRPTSQAPNKWATLWTAQPLSPGQQYKHNIFSRKHRVFTLEPQPPLAGCLWERATELHNRLARVSFGNELTGSTIA